MSEKFYHKERQTQRRLNADPEHWAPEDIRYLAEFLSKSELRRASRMLFKRLRMCSTEESADKLSKVIGILLKGNLEWFEILSRSTRKRGRCPKRFRRRLSVFLLEYRRVPETLESMAIEESATTEIDVERPSSQKIEQQQPVQHRKRYKLCLGNKQLGIFELPSLFSELNKVGEVDHIDLEISGEPFYVYGLAVLRSWLSARKMSVSCSKETKLESYLDAIGFFKTPSDETTFQPLFDRRTHLGLTLIGTSHHFDTGLTIQRFLRLFEPHLPPDQEDIGALAISLAELVENVTAHSRSKTPGSLIAQIHPRRHKLMIAIADTGIGIWRSFLMGDNLQAKRTVKSDLDALTLACKALITSKQKGHAGYGLYIVSELAQLNGGTFVLSSGEALLSRWGKFNTWGAIKRSESTEKQNRWDGTVVCLMLDYSRRIPIDEVYDSLPMIEGHTKEDFFT